MAVDKLVDSAQLNSDLTSVANAIRTKGGTSASLAFPSGFVTAIGNISTGGTPRTSDDLEVSGATVTAPAGTYASAASKSVASGTAGTPTATKGTVSNHSVSVTPSVTNTTGYITGSTKTGTAVTVSASELVSGSETKTQNGTYDVTNLAQLIVNVAGGGGSGLTYETGTYTPISDVYEPTINFSNSHTNRPFIVIIQDMSGANNIAASNSNLVSAIVNWYDFSGVEIYGSTSNMNYARILNVYKSSSGMTGGTVSITSLTGTTSSSMSYWLSNTSFKAGTNSAARYWRSGRTYKWVAVWGPTT